jgi:alpha-tubulin suppressor-like RCC1 family protein
MHAMRIRLLPGVGTLMTIVLNLLALSTAGAAVYHFGPDGASAPAGPTIVAALAGASRVDAANASEYILEGGKLYALGGNESGQLGNGTGVDSESPVAVHFPAGVEITAIGEADRLGLAVDSKGHAWSWGDAGDELCQGKRYKETDILEPKEVAGIEGAVAVQGGASHESWLLANGHVMSCGVNNRGQLGDGTAKDAVTPVEVLGLSEVVEVSVGSQTSCARTAAGAVYDWGSDEWGEIGNGTTGDFVDVPYHVPLPGPASMVSCGGSLPSNGHTLALVHGVTYGWGNGEQGQLGDGALANASSPTLATEVPTLAAVVASGESSLGLTPAGEVLAWGSNLHHALGQGARKVGTRSLVPLLVATDAVEISATASDGMYRTE